MKWLKILVFCFPLCHFMIIFDKKKNLFSFMSFYDNI